MNARLSCVRTSSRVLAASVAYLLKDLVEAKPYTRSASKHVTRYGG